MSETELQIDRLKTAVRTFQEAGIDFVLIGGLAMIAHGFELLTLKQLL